MKRTIVLWPVAAMSLLFPAAAAGAQSAQTVKYGQKLVNDVLVKHPEVVALGMHVTPPGGSVNQIIASNFGKIGTKTEPGILTVIQTGKPKRNVSKTGDRFDVDLPLQDVTGNTIGALAVGFRYNKGDEDARFLKEAEQIRSDLRRRTLTAENLLEPYQWDPRTPTNTYAQKLVDDAMSKYPELLVLAMHVTPPNSPDNQIIASNFGRIGKKADEGDLLVMRTGKASMAVSKTGDRFGGGLPLRDVSGTVIGTLAVQLSYKAGDDKVVLVKEAERVRDELQARIQNRAKLSELTP